MTFSFVWQTARARLVRDQSVTPLINDRELQFDAIEEHAARNGRTFVVLTAAA